MFTGEAEGRVIMYGRLLIDIPEATARAGLG